MDNSEPLRVIDHPARRLAGYSIRMSLQNNLTREVWQRFMPERSRLKGAVSTDLFSVQVYDGDIIFSPEIEFVKWATMEIDDTAEIPDGMSELIVPAGKYAVFLHQGPAAAFPKTLSIIMQWMNKNGYTFDTRPQFELLAEDYAGPMSHDAEEEVWIPIRSI